MSRRVAACTMRILVSYAALLAACSSQETHYTVYDQQLDIGQAFCAQLARCADHPIDVDACASGYADSVCKQAYIDEHGVARIRVRCWEDADPDDQGMAMCMEAFDKVECNATIQQGVCDGYIH